MRSGAAVSRVALEELQAERDEHKMVLESLQVREREMRSQEAEQLREIDRLKSLAEKKGMDYTPQITSLKAQLAEIQVSLLVGVYLS